jgi:hypothetical protein
MELDDAKQMLLTPLCCHVLYCRTFASHIFDTILYCLTFSSHIFDVFFVLSNVFISDI